MAHIEFADSIIHNIGRPASIPHSMTGIVVKLFINLKQITVIQEDSNNTDFFLRLYHE